MRHNPDFGIDTGHTFTVSAGDTSCDPRADAMFRNGENAGAVALGHIDSPDLDNFEDAMILKTFGDVPEDFDYAGR